MLIYSCMSSGGPDCRRSSPQTRGIGQKVSSDFLCLYCSCLTLALHTQELITTAHQSLGYNIAPGPISPEHDSIRTAWRSSSQACLDVPDSGGTPRRSPRRGQSAPDVLEFVTKISPPTPVRSIHQAETGNGTGRRMQAALGLETEAGDGDSNHEEVGIGRGREQEQILPPTPTTSPAKRWVPMTSIQHKTTTKRARQDRDQVVEKVLRTPTTSPLRTSQLANITPPTPPRFSPHAKNVDRGDERDVGDVRTHSIDPAMAQRITAGIVERKQRENGASGDGKGLKPLSLRSRLRRLRARTRPTYPVVL